MRGLVGVGSGLNMYQGTPGSLRLSRVLCMHSCQHEPCHCLSVFMEPHLSTFPILTSFPVQQLVRLPCGSSRLALHCNAAARAAPQDMGSATTCFWGLPH